MKRETIAVVIAVVVLGGTLPLTAGGTPTSGPVADTEQAVGEPAQETTTDGGDESETGISVGGMEIPTLKLENVTARNVSVGRLIVMDGSGANMTRTDIALDSVFVANATADIDLQNITIRNESLAIDLLSTTAGDRTELTPRKNVTIESRTVEGVTIEKLVVRTASADGVVSGVGTGQAPTETTDGQTEAPAIAIGTATVQSVNGTVEIGGGAGNATTPTAV